MRGTVRSLADYGAFVDIGGVDGLLHVSDIAWGRVEQAGRRALGGPADRSQGAEDRSGEAAHFAGHEAASAAIRGTRSRKSIRPASACAARVTRIVDFGAFVELEPGIEGLIHLSEMSWAKKVRKPSDMVKPGETVEAVILGVNAGERRISLGLKQALGDPWAEVARRVCARHGDRRAGHQHHQVRRVRAACRRRRGHDPRQRDQRREAHRASAGRAEGRASRSEAQVLAVDMERRQSG